MKEKFPKSQSDLAKGNGPMKRRREPQFLEKKKLKTCTPRSFVCASSDHLLFERPDPTDQVNQNKSLVETSKSKDKVEPENMNYISVCEPDEETRSLNLSDSIHRRVELLWATACPIHIVTDPSLLVDYVQVQGTYQ